MVALTLFFTILAVAYARDGWWRQLLPPGSEPGPRIGGAAAVIGDSLYILGGDSKPTGFLRYYTYRWNPDDLSWSRLPSSSALPNDTAYSDVDAAGPYLFMFGGANNQGGYFNDIYVMNPRHQNPNWTFVQDSDPQPGQRNGHTTTEIDGVIYVFGGWDTTKYYNDLWSFDTQALINGTFNGSWREFSASNAPSPRNSHSAVEYEGKLVVFGGFYHNVQQGDNTWTHCQTAADDCRWYNDLYFFYTSSPSWQKISPSGSWPDTRSQHACEVIGERMLVFGGRNGNGDKNDLWSYQFSRNEWTQLQPSGNIPTARHSMIAGAIGGVLYIYGGSTGTQDTWSFTLNVEQTYDTVDQVNLDPLTGASVFNVLLVFAIAVVVFFTYKHTRGGHSSHDKDTAINEIE